MSAKVSSATVNSEEISKYLTQRYTEYFLNGVILEASPISDYLSLPELGDHLVTPRPGYTHHGIYSGNKKVIHYSGLSDGLNSGPVEEVSLDSFCNGKIYKIISHPKSEYTKEQIVENARSRLFEENYKLLNNNCEHFVNKCVYNVNTSGQVGTGLTIAAHTILKQVGRSNVVTATVVSVISTSQHIVSFIKGDINKEKLIEEISHSAVTTTSTLYYAGLGQAAIPIPIVGAFIGASVGYFIGNSLLRSGLLALGDSDVVKAAKGRRREIEKICESLIPSIQKSRKELEDYIDKYFAERKQDFFESFDALDDSLENWDADSYVSALSRINNQFGITLQIKTFEEFDILMGSDEAFEF